MNFMKNHGTYECLSENIYYTDTAPTGVMFMTNTGFHTDYSGNGKMKVIFEFPAKSAMDELIKKEVNSIMKSTLHEQLHHKTS